MRCINVIEKNDLIYSNEKFRVLTGQAYVCSGRNAEAISVLEAKIHCQEVISLDVAPGDTFGATSSDNDPVNAGNPSSGFGVGSSSNQSYQNMINMNDLIDDFV